ncbi:nitroreductase [Flavobacterium sp. Sd200]|uniref:nitroreductase family protein n=1 Tax=Flavobacterium sp. Sd200 TaxID=2692211 RepID=UPI00136D731E|nr:nitroreductase [Flavobacterium sp. Sd200]MXN90474.1 nitroreductase [Flavobacterium sp. Sd200]
MKKILMLVMLAAIVVSCNDAAPIQQTTYTGSQKQAILDNILTRRSIRKYTAQQVTKAQIDTIMKSAIYAPSALNKQPWEVRVVQNQEILKEINQRFLNFAEGKEFQGSAAHYKEPGFSIFHNAPTLIVIARDKSSDISYLDSGIILQNILLSSHAIGLGTCPLGTLVSILNNPDNKDILELLNIPDGYEVAINISLGYPAEAPVAPKRFAQKVKIIE